VRVNLVYATASRGQCPRRDCTNLTVVPAANVFEIPTQTPKTSSDQMRILLLVSAIHFMLTLPAVAQQPDQNIKQPQATAETESPVALVPTISKTGISLDELVDELGSPRFAVRNQAARKLKAAGQRGIETLRRVTQTGTKETASQALIILQEHMANKNNHALQIAAQNALEEISADEKNPSSSVAKGILNQEDSEQSNQNQQLRKFPMFVPRMNRVAGMRIQVKNKNGKLQIQHETNGEKTKITEVEDGIEVEKKDANGKATKNTYKNADEMKEKDKNAHQIFQQYKKTGGRIQIQINGNPLQFKAQPLKIPNLNPNAPKNGAPKNMEDMQRQMLKRHRDMMELHLRKMQENIENNVPKENRKQLEEQLKKQREMMNRPLLEIERKLKLSKPPQIESQPGSEAEAPNAADKAPVDKAPVEKETAEKELIEV
jgi:hypothetical protein